jgi:hypothetical protein
LQFGLLVDFTGEELLTSFANDSLGESAIIDYCVHCMRHEDIVHKLDSCGYRVFLTTRFFVSFPTTPFFSAAHVVYTFFLTIPFFPHSSMSHHAKQYSILINLRQKNSKSCGDI